MLTSLFDYELPDELVAQRPLPRGESRLLVVDRTGSNRHLRFRDLPSLLSPDDLLVVNDTRVIPARLFARREGLQRPVELLLLEPLPESPTTWTVLARPGKRIKTGARLDLDPELYGIVEEKGQEGRVMVRFSEPVEPHLERLGHVPLPPYIRRPDESGDRDSYQTIFAKRPGAIAAPTAGLHFSPDVVQALHEGGARLASVTLHVGIGTFRPVTAERVSDHHMDAERYELSSETVDAVLETRKRGGRVVAVGTTVVRTLEGNAAEQGELRAGVGSTNLFIVPGFGFQVVDALVTNFHLPRSTLLMLVSALAGRERVLSAYREAVEQRYRFYSYGDAMLVPYARAPTG